MRARTHSRWLALASAGCPGGETLPAAAPDCDVTVDWPGLALGASYWGAVRRKSIGGTKAGTAYDQMLTLGAAWRNDTLFSEASVSANAAVMYMGGHGISGEYVGDLQGLNNSEADEGWILYELWTEFAFGDSQTTVRAG